MTEIAVVLSCYELGRTLEDAVRSARGQTRPPAEIVVVDDGSTGVHTLQVLVRVAGPSVRVVRIPHRGVAVARNVGVRLTSAPYIVLLDADDVLEPEYLARAAALLDADAELDFVSCGLRAFEGAEYVWHPPPPTLVSVLARGGPHISTMFRRSLWDVVGGFDESLEGYEDTDFWTTALDRGARGIVLPEPLLRYRVRPDSRYRQAILPDRYVRSMGRIHERHRDAVETVGLDLLRAKERFLTEQRGHRASLDREIRDAEAELARLRAAVADLSTALASAGRGRIDWGDARRPTPLGPAARGTPVDRHFVETFMRRHAGDITGQVLEVPADANAHPDATTPSDAFDCVIATRTFHTAYDVETVLRHAYRVLKPGGVLLCALPALSPVNASGDGGEDEGWRFTPAGVRHLFAQVFPVDAFDVESFGNVKTCAAFLLGLAAEGVPAADLETNDPWFPVVSCVRGVKPAEQRTTLRFGGGSRVETAGAAIIFYHRIASLAPDPHGLCVSPATFRAHMAHLRAHHEVTSLERLIDDVRAGRTLRGAVALTFDDGYLDNLTTASDILTELELPATFFVTSESLDVEREYWWDTLERLFLSGGPPLPPVLELVIGGSPRRFSTASPGDRTTTHDTLVAACYEASAEGRDEILTRLVTWSGSAERPRATHRPLTAPEIRRLASRPGMTIGAHTIHHLRLPGHALEVRRHEIMDDKATLERLLGQPVTTFSYPYGELDDATVELVREAGFRGAVTVAGEAVLPVTDPFRLPRFEIRECTPAAFADLVRRAAPA